MNDMVETAVRKRNGKGAQFTRADPGVAITLKLHQTDVDRLAAIATREERSISAQIRYIIRESIRQYEV